MKTRKVAFDTLDTEEVFGIKWKGFGEQVRSVVRHYLEIYGKEQK